MSRARLLIVLACVALIGFGLLRSLELRGPDRPEGTFEDIESLRERDDLNLIVILIDTLRADRMSAYGYERPTTPVLSAMAQSGVLFEHTLAQSTWTKTSMASLLTATYPSTNKITRFNHGVPDGATLPTEMLQRAGYRTVGLWRNGWVSPNFGFDQGYDVYLKPFPKDLGAAENPSAAGLLGTDQTLIESAAQFLRNNQDERFYLYLHMMDVHQYVYDGSVNFGNTYSDIYDQSIRFVDAQVGTLIAHLQQLGLMKKTVIAIISDHGEAFREHGTEGHARDLYEPTTRVPFIITLPFRLKEPLVVRTPAENIDVYPTLFDLIGMPPMKEADGKSLVPYMLAAARGEEGEPHEYMEPRFSYLDTHWARMMQEPAPLILVQQGRYRLHQPGDDKPELFDALEDPGEQRDIVRLKPEQAAELQQLAIDWAAAPDPSWGQPSNVTVDEMEANQLRALGYVVDPHAPRDKRKIERQ